MNQQDMRPVKNYAENHSCCIKDIFVIDHDGQVKGRQQVGMNPLTEEDAKTLCDALCDGANVVLYGCEVGYHGADSESIKMPFENCPKIKKITACPWEISTNCPDEQALWKEKGCIERVTRDSKGPPVLIRRPDGTKTDKPGWKDFTSMAK